MLRRLCALLAVLVFGSVSQAADGLKEGDRVAIIGDSITEQKLYSVYMEDYLLMCKPVAELKTCQFGWSGETSWGFLARMNNDMTWFHPTVATSCYGMNDGIYYPFDQTKFEAYQRGIQLLRQRVLASGAKIIHVTPPVFDPVPIRAHTLPAGRSEYRQPYEGYDNVLERYSEWLIGQRKNGWTVIDAHSPMKHFLDQERLKNPAFLLAPDGVHLNDQGHWLLAQALLRGLQKPEARLIDTVQSPELPNDARDREILALIHKRNRMLSDSWLTTVGHKRPGMEKGLQMAEAMEKAEVLKHQIKELCNSNGH
jgi:lysophospholipase L1-like esterase